MSFMRMHALIIERFKNSWIHDPGNQSANYFFYIDENLQMLLTVHLEGIQRFQGWNQS